MSLQIEGLSAMYGKLPVLHQVTLGEVPRGSLTVLLGPNAAGKSTLFKSIIGIVESEAEKLCLCGKSLSNLPKAQRMKEVCYMPQSFSSSALLTVFEVVLLARKTTLSWSVTQDDLDVVSDVIERMGIEHIANRPISELSGGQQQMASLCQVLVKDASLYLLDEPTSALDLRRQLNVLEVLKQETESRNLVTIVTLHDLNLAVKFADQIIVMQEGRVVDFGETVEVFESGVLSSVYSVDLELMKSKSGAYVVAAKGYN